MPTRMCGSGSVPSGSRRPARTQRSCWLRCRGCGNDSAASKSAQMSSRARKVGRRPVHSTPSVRSRVLDALGIDAQLVFPTFALGQFARSHDPAVRYGGTRALNRAMAEFCATDERLLAVGYLPLNEPGRATKSSTPRSSSASPPSGCRPKRRGLLARARRPRAGLGPARRSPASRSCCMSGAASCSPKEFHENGRPRPVDWLGGGENLRGKDFPVLHHSPERFLACLVLDGVFQRHPQLRGAAIELGASWVPGMLRNLDHAHRSFSKFEPLLQELRAQPSDYIRRQVRFTPFPFEDTLGSSSSADPSCSCSPPTTRIPRAGGGRSRSSATRWPVRRRRARPVLLAQRRRALRAGLRWQGSPRSPRSIWLPRRPARSATRSSRATSRPATGCHPSASSPCSSASTGPPSARC